MKKWCLVACSILMFLKSNAQKELTPLDLEGETYIYTTDGQVIKGENLKYFKGDYFLLDSVKYDARKVLFYRDISGFFANVSQSDEYITEPLFAKNTRMGKVNYYVVLEKGIVSSGGGTYMYNSQGMPTYMSSGTRGVVNRKGYINRGFGAITKVTYLNLKEEFKDSQASLRYLEKYKKRKSIWGVLLGSGIVATGVGIGVSVGGLYPIAGAAILFLGIGCLVAQMVSGLFIIELSPVIDIYNES